MKWFRNLKKWQKGGLIGLGIGLLFAVIILLSPYGNPLGEWIANVHEIIFELIWLGLGLSESSLAAAIVDYGGLVVIVIFYGVLGILIGRAQQITKPVWKWLLTALLALFLLFFYSRIYY